MVFSPQTRQAGFMESYFATQRENIFRNVEVLIYVFDVESQDYKRDIVSYRNCLDAINEHSPGAKVFCLIHKMDLVPQHKQAAVCLLSNSKVAVQFKGSCRTRKAAYCSYPPGNMCLLWHFNLGRNSL